MCSAIPAFVFLLFSIILTKADDETTPKEPRFCGLTADATNFTCNVRKYGSSLLDRSLPVIIVAASLLLIISVIIFLPCCARIGACTCIGSDAELGDTRYGSFKQAFWFVLAMLILVGGCCCGIYANVKSNEMVGTITTMLSVQVDELKAISENVTNVLQNTTLYAPHAVADVQSALDDLNANLDSNSIQMKKVGPYKDIYAYVSAIWIVLLGVITLLYVATGNKFLFHLIGFMAWWTLLGVCIYLVAMSFVGIFLTDICHEVQYKPGLLDLVQNNIKDSYSELTTTISRGASEIVNSTCDYLHENCLTQPDLCYCNESNFSDLPHRHVIDKGLPVTVQECSTQCTDSQLKNMSQIIVDAVHFHSLVVSLENSLKQLLEGFLGENVKDILKLAACQSYVVINPLWAACALVLLGLAFVGMTLLVLDRAVCCFKGNYWNSDEYHKMQIL